MAKAAWFCTQCEQLGTPRTVTKGSFVIEVLAWLCFLIPGVLYSLWRLTTRHKACPHCGSASIVPSSSPRAQAAAARQA